MTELSGITHTVTNQSTSFTDVNLFSGNRPLQDVIIERVTVARK
jgi:hypothetical protein